MIRLTNSAEVLQHLDEHGTLQGTDMAGIVLSGLDLSKVSLAGANLVGSRLNAVDLSDSQLDGVNLERGALSKVSCRNTNFSSCNFWRCSFAETSLDHTKLRHTNVWDISGWPFSSPVMPEGTVSLDNYRRFFHYYLDEAELNYDDLTSKFTWATEEPYLPQLDRAHAQFTSVKAS